MESIGKLSFTEKGSFPFWDNGLEKCSSLIVAWDVGNITHWRIAISFLVNYIKLSIQLTHFVGKLIRENGSTDKLILGKWKQPGKHAQFDLNKNW